MKLELFENFFCTSMTITQQVSELKSLTLGQELEMQSGFFRAEVRVQNASAYV